MNLKGKIFWDIRIKFLKGPEAEFKEFEPRLKHGWFNLKLY